MPSYRCLDGQSPYFVRYSAGESEKCSVLCIHHGLLWTIAASHMCQSPWSRLADHLEECLQNGNPQLLQHVQYVVLPKSNECTALYIPGFLYWLGVLRSRRPVYGKATSQACVRLVGQEWPAPRSQSGASKTSCGELQEAQKYVVMWRY